MCEEFTTTKCLETKRKQNKNDDIVCGSALHKSFCLLNSMHLLRLNRQWMNDAFAALVIHSLLSYYIQYAYTVPSSSTTLNTHGSLHLSFCFLSLFSFFSFHHHRCRFSFFIFCFIVGDFLVVFQLSYISHAFHFIMRIQLLVDGADQLYTVCVCVLINVCVYLNACTPYLDILHFVVVVVVALYRSWIYPLLT